jgi:hypothetical protein
MANGNQKNSDLVNWQISGIKAERERVQARLTYLENEEKRLAGSAMIGTAKASKAKNAAPKTRKRKISPEARQKMRDAANKRWANAKGETTSGSTTEIVPPPIG